MAPAIPFADPFVLRFKIQVTDPLFLNYTLASGGTDFYYFSNEHDSAVETEAVPYLSRKIAVHDPQREYRAGELALNVTKDKLFEAIRSNRTESLPSGDTNSNDYWRKIQRKAYISKNDQLPYKQLPFFISVVDRVGSRLEDVKKIHAELLRDGITVPGLDVVTIESSNPQEDPLKGVNVAWKTIPATMKPGIYSLLVSFEDEAGNKMEDLAFTKTFYLDLSPGIRPFAILELHHNPANTTSEFRLLDVRDPGEGEPLESLIRDSNPVFRIWWKNRIARLQYRLFSSAVSNGSNSTLPTTPVVINTSEPLPFLRSNQFLGLKCIGEEGNKELTIVPGPDLQMDESLPSLPNPVPDRIRLEQDGWYTDVFTTVHPSLLDQSNSS